MSLFSHDTKAEALGRVPLFSGLSKRELTQLAKITEDLQGIHRTVSMMRELLQRFDDLKPKRDGPRSFRLHALRRLGNSGMVFFFSDGKWDRYGRLFLPSSLPAERGSDAPSRSVPSRLLPHSSATA